MKWRAEGPSSIGVGVFERWRVTLFFQFIFRRRRPWPQSTVDWQVHGTTPLAGSQVRSQMILYAVRLFICTLYFAVLDSTVQSQLLTTKAAFTPAQHVARQHVARQQVARNKLLVARFLRATCCLKKHVARNKQLVAGNKQLGCIHNIDNEVIRGVSQYDLHC